MNPINQMRPIHPGEILREEFMHPLGMTVHALTMELKIPESQLSELLEERSAISPDMALRLARYFGTSARFWMNLQTSYDLKIAEQQYGSRIAQEVQARQAA